MTVEEMNDLERYADYFLGCLDRLHMLSGAEVRDVLQLASRLATECTDSRLQNKGLDLLYKGCFYMKLDLKELWNVYWLLTRRLFAEADAQLSEGGMDELYRYIFTLVSGSITDSYEWLEEVNDNLVVVITSQFLRANHAPTRRVLDYSYALVTALNKEVLIVNDSGYHYHLCECIVQLERPVYVDEYNAVQGITYKGLVIPYIQLNAYMPDFYCINEALRRIYQLRPGLVYNIGDSSLVADLCGRFTKTACFPCGTDIPVTMSKNLFVGRPIEERDTARLKRLEPYQRVFETVVNYQLGESSVTYHRAMFGLREDDFVIGIVGNRLEDEVTDDFTLWMNQVLEQADVQFLLIGHVYDVERIRERISRKERLHFAGRISEADQAMEILDLYCNPKRSGGGRSSFEALAHGIPVLTLKYGDVYYTCGSEFGVNTYEDFTEEVKRCMSDAAYVESLRKAAFRRAECLSDLPRALREALDRIA